MSRPARQASEPTGRPNRQIESIHSFPDEYACCGRGGLTPSSAARLRRTALPATAGQRSSPKTLAFVPASSGPIRDRTRPLAGPPALSQGRYPRWRRAPRRLLLQPQSQLRPRWRLERRRSSRLPDLSARLAGECSWQTNIGNDVGVEPTTPRVMVLCSTDELVVVAEPVGPGPCQTRDTRAARRCAPAGIRRARTQGVQQGPGR
jgi:hypothetical protein